MTLVLAAASRAMAGTARLQVGKPHGAEGGFDPHSAYEDGIDDTNFFQYLFGAILPHTEPSEWASGIMRGFSLGGTQKVHL